MHEERRSRKIVLHVQDLVVNYYKKEILRGATLDLKDGEIVTLLGANGSGKSTLLKTIGGLLRPLRGRVVLDGQDITNSEAHKMAGLGVGFLMQGGAVFPSLTVEEHLQLATRSIGKSSLEKRLPVVWNTLPALAGFQRKRAGLLSGGERQMLALAMLLVQKARLWLLDEPSVGLDVEAARTLFDVIKFVNQTEKVSILLVEQNLTEGVRVADRVYVLRNGLTVLEDSANNLMVEGKLKTLFFS